MRRGSDSSRKESTSESAASLRNILWKWSLGCEEEAGGLGTGRPMRHIQQHLPQDSSLVAPGRSAWHMKLSRAPGCGGSWRDPVFAAGKVDSTNQAGNAWPGAWKVLETAPSMGAGGSSPPWTGNSFSEFCGFLCISNVYLLLGLQLVLCPPETNPSIYTLNCTRPPWRAGNESTRLWKEGWIGNHAPL